MRPLRYLLLLLPLLAGGADYPAWWLDRGVIVTNGAVTNDYAGVNAGQLKWMVLQARDELDAHLPGGAGTNIAALVDGFTASNNYPWVNLGQLKNAASRFHERLIAEGYATNYPWTTATTDDCDYAAANLGQLKNLFSFELRTDSDQDGMPDWWESHYFGDPTNALPTDDADGDGYLNVYEAMHGGNPTNGASIPVATRYVSLTGSHSGGFSNWACAATNIQAALDAATSDCEIIAVANGVYAGTGNVEVTFPTDRPVMLVSTGGAHVCLVDCQRVAGKSGIKFMGGQDRRSVLKGITIRNIYAAEYTEAFGIICSEASPTILNCRILDATSDGALLLLSGILCEDSSAVIRNTVVANCRGSTGNAIETHGQCMVSVENCTIVRNRFEWGGGIGGEAFVRNCIVWGNSPGQLSSTSVSYSLVEGGWTGEGNFSADPKLSPYGFWLMGDSPCIDAGAANTLLADWEGENRHDDPNHQGGAWIWDIGADEFVDSDGDGGSDQLEIACGTDPQNQNSQPFNSADTDGDGMPDWWELLHGLNPQSGADAYGDLDGDGLYDALEWQQGTDPQGADSDGDGCSDGAEFYAGTSPLNHADYPYDRRDHFGPYGTAPEQSWSVDVGLGVNPAYEDVAPGKCIRANTDDDDLDGIADLVDGYNANSVGGDNDDINSMEDDFVPVTLTVDPRCTSGGYQVSLTYPDSVRLWIKQGNTMRKLQSTADGGSRIAGGTSLIWNQGFMGSHYATLYAEGLKAGEGVVTLRLTHYWHPTQNQWIYYGSSMPEDSANVTVVDPELHLPPCMKNEPAESVSATLTGVPAGWAVGWSAAALPHSAAQPVIDQAGRLSVTQDSGMGLIKVTATITAPNPDNSVYTVSATTEAKCGCDGGCGGSGAAGQPAITDDGDATFSIPLGRASQDESAGKLYLRLSHMNAASATPVALHFSGDAGLATFNGGALSQVSTPEVRADIVTLNDFKYYVALYPANEQAAFAVWTIENPDGSAAINRLRITKSATLNGAPLAVHEFRWNATGGQEIALHSGAAADAVMRVESLATSLDSVSGNRLVTRETRDTNGTVCASQRKVYHQFPWGAEFVHDEISGGGQVLEGHSVMYCQDPEQTGAYGRRSEEFDLDGSWTRYEYNAAGLVTNSMRAWLDSPLGSDATNAAQTVFSYDPHPMGDNGEVNPKGPRVVTELIQGQVVGRTYHAYFANSVGDRTEVTERAADPQAEFGSAGNVRTTTETYGPGAGAGIRFKPKRVEYSDGKLELYTYEHGTYTAAGSPGSRQFTPGNGSYLRVSVSNVTVACPGGIPGKTVVQRTVYNPQGHEVLRERLFTTQNQPVRFDWTAHDLDARGRPTRDWFSDGTYADTTPSCCTCNPGQTISQDGARNDYQYDALGNRVLETTHPGGSRPAIYRQYVHDAAGRVLQTTTSVDGGGITPLVITRSYDLAGRMVASVDEAGLVTAYAYSVNMAGRGETVTQPGGATRSTWRYSDGQTASVTGSAGVPTVYQYGHNADGTRFTTIYSGLAGTNSPSWTRTVTDMLGRTVREEKPGFGGSVLTNEYFYNAAGQIARTTAAGTADIVYAYDELGAQIRQGRIEDGVTNWLSGSEATYEVVDSAVWQVRRSLVFPVDNGNAVTSSVQRVLVGGLGEEAGSLGVLTALAVTRDIRGNQTTNCTWINRATASVTQRTDHPDSTQPAMQVSSNGLVCFSISKSGVRTDHFYDGLGRQTNVTSASGAGVPSPRSTGMATYYNDKGQVDWTEDAASNRTWFAYDPATGRRIAVTNAVGEVTETRYDVQGRVTNTWGATYPVAYRFDESGRMTEMNTWRQESEAPDATRWLYDQATGLMTNKLYADTNGTAYVYQPDGKLQQRFWARGESAEYDYSACCGALTGIRYLAGGVHDAATSNVVFGLDRLARQTSVTDAAGTRTLLYAPDTLGLTNETLVTWNGATSVLARVQDAQGKIAGIALDSGYSVNYAYNPMGELHQIGWTVDGASYTATYSFVEGSTLIAGHQIPVGGAVLRTARTFESNRDLVVSVSNVWNSGPVSGFAYGNDAVGRRTSRFDGGAATNLFAYNTRSELTNALMGAASFSWVFDSIGNRQTGVVNSTKYSYTANSLNQYTEITNGGLRSLSYDLDGNLLEDAGWSFAWDGENRLISASNGTTLVTFAYDHMSRRIEKEVSEQVGGQWSVVRSHFFLYDGWNLIQERINDHGSLSTNSYIWGLDLSGTLQGAGGIGGLLCVIQAGTLYFPVCDANGNITEYVDAAGQTVAHYEYGAFGELMASSGAKKVDFSVRFSSKYTDDETGLVYYGYRYYSPVSGRFLSRDPIGEKGGAHIYSAAKNALPSWFDPLGLESLTLEMVGRGARCSCPDELGQTGNKIRDGMFWFAFWLNAGGLQQNHAYELLVKMKFSFSTSSDGETFSQPEGYDTLYQETEVALAYSVPRNGRVYVPGVVMDNSLSGSRLYGGASLRKCRCFKLTGDITSSLYRDGGLLGMTRRLGGPAASDYPPYAGAGEGDAPVIDFPELPNEAIEYTFLYYAITHSAGYLDNTALGAIGGKVPVAGPKAVSYEMVICCNGSNFEQNRSFFRTRPPVPAGQNRANERVIGHLLGTGQPTNN